MSTLHLTAYCESAHCAAGPRGNCAEIELPDDLTQPGGEPEDVRTWGMEVFSGLGWSVEDGEHRCPECTERKRLRDLSGPNPD